MKSIASFALLATVLAYYYNTLGNVKSAKVLAHEHSAKDVNSAFIWAERLVHAQERCRIYHFAPSDTVVTNEDSCASSLELMIKTSALSQSAAQDLCRRISLLTRFGKDHVSASSTKYGRLWTAVSCSQMDKVWQRHYWNIDSQWQP